MANIDWDVSEYGGDQPDSSVIPAGKYVCVISDEKEKTSKTTGHRYVELELTITEGEYQNRKLWDRLCFWYPDKPHLEQKNQPSVVAKNRLASICKAIGLERVRDTSQLLMRSMLVTVEVKNREHNGSTTQQNNVKGYAKAERPQQQPQQAPRQSVPNNDVSPWGNQF